MKSHKEITVKPELVILYTKLHTVITPLANAYIEVACGDMHLPETQRHWTIRRTVDYSRITLQ